MAVSRKRSIFRRGDVFRVAFPFVQDSTKRKIRPAVVVQNDVGNKYSPNIIVLSISSQAGPKVYPMHYPVKAGSDVAIRAGLAEDSVVEAEIILTIPKKLAIEKLGRFDKVAMSEIDKRLKLSLALV
jgi:mRNA interferase MazF